MIKGVLEVLKTSSKTAAHCPARCCQAECDIWILDVERSPFQWQEAAAGRRQSSESSSKIPFSSCLTSEVAVMGKRGPLPRVYHSAEAGLRNGVAAKNSL